MSSFSPLLVVKFQIPVHVHAQALQLYPTPCDPMGCSPSGSSVHGILWARTLEWVASSPSPDLPNPRIEPTSLVSPALAGRFFITDPTGKPLDGYALVYFSGSFNMYTISK